MIQRTQTLFLLATLVLQIIFLSSPLSTFLLEGNEEVKLFAGAFKSQSGETLVSTVAFLILSIGILVLVFIDIFLYKKRILQIRICIYTILLNIGTIGMMAYLIVNFMKHNTVSVHSYSLATPIPLASIILLYLAFRGIRKDEVLVKAYERLR